ncbi:uncharacterized protein LY89DRAFT_670738 [Mollisia scopiformis]|uniref:Clr5 domain-containing protein n=1 Tax=Mollisia scopiformis TaxID=149040 RepID=A0A194X4Y5_MOLSC|nr:uncharacterized protein LY89DRAFT_670738 [Mollisia scopiformis]KUJ15238.1 hypothetical protein LY89DRAFT_670738 [Mollisia scopiformis]
MKPSTLSKNNQKWDLRKEEIYQFYVEEKHTLPITMHTFEQKYGLKASMRKWKLKLDEWKFNKNIRTDEMLFVLAKGEKRAKHDGKDTVFFHGGSRIKRQKIEKFKRKSVANQQTDGTVDSKTPEAIRYHTPSPNEDLTADELPLPQHQPSVLDKDEHPNLCHLPTTEDVAFRQQEILVMDKRYEFNTIHELSAAVPGALLTFIHFH